MGFRAPTADMTCRSSYDPGRPDPAPSVPGVSHALDGLHLPQASDPFQAGAAPGVLPTELSSSPGIRAPLGAVPLLPFPATAFVHSEVCLDGHGSSRLQGFLPPDESAPRGTAVPPTGRCSPGFPSLQGSHHSVVRGASAGIPPRTSPRPRLAKDGVPAVPRGVVERDGQVLRRRTTDLPGIFHLISP